jgi:hypothetical protein
MFDPKLALRALERKYLLTGSGEERREKRREEN